MMKRKSVFQHCRSALLVAILLSVLGACSKPSKSSDGIDHSSCLLVGYVHPAYSIEDIRNNPKTPVSWEPVYGYNALYMLPGDSYPFTTYHFH